MPYLSLIIPTVRHGGLDWLFDSLAAQSWTDFELVLVDRHYDRRKQRVQEEARDRFLAIRHVGLSPTPKVCSFCAYANAGIVASTGEVLVFAVDYSRLGPDVLRKHAEFHKATDDKAGLMCPHRYMQFVPADGMPVYGRGDIDQYDADVDSGKLDPWMWSSGICSDVPSVPHDADGGAVVPFDADPKLKMAAGPIGPEFFHAKNESVKRSAVLAINGWDQDLDGAHLYQDTDFADRLTVKAGVNWTLDPTNVIDIVNPRLVFPFSRRARPHETNHGIWQAKKAAGYPQTGPLLQELPVNEEEIKVSPSPFQVAEKTEKPLKLAMIYGEFSSAIHGPFDVEGLYTRVGLTGSESSFFNLARGLARRGHSVAAFCHCEGRHELADGLAVLPIQDLRGIGQLALNAVIAWNEPDYLSAAPAGAKRYVDQQLNDWGYCRDPQWRDIVDMFVFPSENSRQHHVKDEGLVKADTHGIVVPNSVDLSLFQTSGIRDPKKVAYCSSPDRGLHHLLSMWPEIRKRVPEATLDVYYRLDPWLARARENGDEVGKRARYIEAVLPRLLTHGVTVRGPVPNRDMALALSRSRVLAYPCDPVRYTEGFGCSVLDAATAGCVPVISNADALPSVHGLAASVIDGNPGDPKVRGEWIEIICAILSASETPKDWTDRMTAHARKHSLEAVTAQWEALLTEHA